jgi:methyl-accepting chemotaxis protein
MMEKTLQQIKTTYEQINSIGTSNSSFRNASSILETTNNLMQTLDSYSKDNKRTNHEVFEAKKGKGIRVEELINKFKNEANFDTMCKRPADCKQKESQKCFQRQKD